MIIESRPALVLRKPCLGSIATDVYAAVLHENIGENKLNYSVAKSTIFADQKSTMQLWPTWLSIVKQKAVSSSYHPLQHTNRLNYRKRVNLNRLLTKLFTTFLPMQNNGYRVMGFSVEKRQSSQFERQPFKSAQLLSTSPSIPITAALI